MMKYILVSTTTGMSPRNTSFIMLRTTFPSSFHTLREFLSNLLAV
jgi:hypothetical protein